MPNLVWIKWIFVGCILVGLPIVANSTDAPIAKIRKPVNQVTHPVNTLEVCLALIENANTPGQAGCYSEESVRLEEKLEIMLKPSDEHRKELEQFGATKIKIREIEIKEVEAQKLWEQYRDAFCSAVYDDASVYGMGAQIEYPRCQIRLTRHRIEDVRM